MGADMNKNLDSILVLKNGEILKSHELKPLFDLAYKRICDMANADENFTLQVSVNIDNTIYIDAIRKEDDS